ncbi:MAG: PAS domain S-box protein, partial [Burkholderiales bacterium]
MDCRRVQALYRLAPGGAFVGAVVASIAIATLVPFTRGSLLLGWYLGVLLVVATVFVLVRAYRGAPDVDDHPLRWESRFALLAAVRGAAWGALSLVPDRATYLPQVFVLFVIGGVGIGSIGPLGASRRAYAAFAVPLLAIPALQLFAAGGPVYRPMGLLAIAFGAALAFVFLVHNRAVLAGIGGALRNGRLAAEQRALFENASVGIAMMKDDCIADCNRRFAELVGAPHESLLGQPVAALVGDQEGWREARSALAGIGAAVERLRDELPVRRQDGTLVWCDVSMSLLNAESPGQGIVGFFVDIGARKQADNELHRALAEQQAIFDASSAGIALVRETRLVKVNERMAELFGYTPAELAGLTMNTLFASENEWRRSLWQAEAELSQGRGFQQEVRLVRKNRSELWCLMQGRAIRTAYPREGLILTFSDVTERKSAEAQLRASEQRLELVVSAAQSGVWDWDIVAKTAYFSPRFKEILGCAGDADLRDLFTFSERLHPEDRDRVLAAQERAVLELAPFDEEYRLARADGTYVWLRGSGRVIAGPNGRAQRFVGAVHDISDRKRVEAQLRESEAHFRRLVETSNDLIWEIDAQRCWTYLSPRAARQLFGRESEDLVGELFTSTQPESERDRTDSMLDRVLAGEMVSRFQTVHLDLLGERISLSYNATPVRDAAGNVRGASGTATDIGERLAREAQLAAALAEQELIFEAASEGIVFEKDGIVRKCNGMFASMLGHRPEDLVGQLTSIWFADPADFERSALAAQRRIRSGQV